MKSEAADFTWKIRLLNTFSLIHQYTEFRNCSMAAASPKGNRYLQEAVNDAIAYVMILKDPRGKWIH